MNYKFIKLQPFIRFLDVSATTAAFIRMTVHHQVSTRQTVSSHRCTPNIAAVCGTQKVESFVRLEKNLLVIIDFSDIFRVESLYR